ncbi:hypothetical protein M9H77_23739 [Catharanthus roseus]|uniref:Uncharacterized protein n=1 Tax=Catharanthus roseus TaxID=4058 RepID=A0ACC0AUX2_CATRO|nr:hypothetical protein M9H77_23739 [Catharanthus roseus]
MEKKAGTLLQGHCKDGENGTIPTADGRFTLPSPVQSAEEEMVEDLPPRPLEHNIEDILNENLREELGMEAIGRQEMAYSKLTRARSNYYTDGDYGGNAYRGSHRRDGNYTHRSQMGIKFWRQNMENEGKMDYYSYDIISFPPPPQYIFKSCKAKRLTRDKHENLKIFQGPTTMSGPRKLEEESEEMMALLGRTFMIIRGSH